MPEAYKPIWMILAGVAGAIAIIGVSRRAAPHEIVTWRTDYDTAMQEAKHDGKPVLLDFAATWCGPCEQMKGTTWADRDVEAAVRPYIRVRVDIDQNPALAQEYQVQAIPKMVVIDAQGKMHSESGYLGPEDFLQFLKGG